MLRVYTDIDEFLPILEGDRRSQRKDVWLSQREDDRLSKRGDVRLSQEGRCYVVTKE